jgi:hypothetical protein
MSNMSLDDLHKNQMKELTTQKLQAYSNFVALLVEPECRKCETNFVRFRPPAISQETMDAIIARTKKDFPALFKFHNGMILPERNRDTDHRQKELSALWVFISSIWKRDTSLCISLASIIALSLAGGNVSKKAIKFVCHTGISASQSVVTRRMKGIATRSAKTWEWQILH